ncbi:MAG: hypothetical protein HZC41_05515 [Chloroflexi bacterium]|nr:hypothetical protein [Chloroflexota bacterium]
MMLPVKVKHEANFDELHRVLLRQGEIGRVPVMEMLVDREIIAALMNTNGTPTNMIEEARWTRMQVELWVNLGADAISMRPIYNLPFGREKAEDTAGLNRGNREWATMEAGLIKSWDDFERYPWPDPKTYDYSQIELAGKIMPPGMKVFGYIRGVLEPTMWIMSYEAFAFALYDDPALVKAVCDKVAEIHVPMAQTLLDMPWVGGLWGSDDMGFRTGTLASPKHLREMFLPHHKRLARLAHDAGKLYLLHSCGNLETIMDDLIEDVKIDGKHSYEDAIIPVGQFKKKYGDRVAVLGGIDIDVLTRRSEDEVRAYVRHVLDECMPGGGYVLGTGNSVANYVPPRNFLAMIDEGHRWQPA